MPNLVLEKRCIKFIWNLFNSGYNLHMAVVKYFFYNGVSTLAENIRYLMYNGWMLGLILNQTHISTQLIKRCIRFLFGIASSYNIVVYTCYKNAVGNANTPMGSNIAYFRNKYGIEVNRLSKNITKLVSEPKLSTEQLIVIQHLRDLLDINNNACTLDNFSEEDIDMLIQEVATR